MPESETPPVHEPRRNVVKSVLAGAISAVLGAVPLGTGLLFFLDPLKRKKSSAGEGNYIPLGVNADAIQEGAEPQMVRVFADKIDAWNKYKNVPIGTVWLTKQDGEVRCFNTVCPHLGCSVDYRPSENDFFCPCHTSAFALSGEKKNAIPPRDLDTLELRTRDGQLEVDYKNFRAGDAEKIPT